VRRSGGDQEKNPSPNQPGNDPRLQPSLPGENPIHKICPLMILETDFWKAKKNLKYPPKPHFA
jgi:hypothetical protein